MSRNLGVLHMKIPLYFLGTSQAIPTARRNHTAMLLEYKNENILVDCGEGTQRQFRKLKLNPCKLTRILITHWHGDHVLGLPGLFQTLALNNYNKTLYVYGPKGTKKFISFIYNMFVFSGKIKIQVEEVEKSKFLETPDFYIESLPLEHGTFTNGYSFVEKDRLRIDKNKLKKLKIPSSPLLSELQQGKNIKLNNRTIKSSDVTFLQKGRKLSFVLDTQICDNCEKLAKNSDILVTESTYADSEKELAKEYRHLTASQAATIAKNAKSKKPC